GVAGDVERDTAFVEDVSDLLADVVDDLYVRRFHGADRGGFGRAEAMAIAWAAGSNPAAPIEPASAPDWSMAAMRRRLAVGGREARARGDRLSHRAGRPGEPGAAPVGRTGFGAAAGAGGASW